MDVRAVGLVLLAAAIHAAWNVRLKTGEDRGVALAIAYCVGGVVLLPWLVLLPPTHAAALVPLSAGAEVVYAAALAAAYHRGRLALAYPIGRGIAPLVVTLAAIVVLHQNPSAMAIAGAVCLGVGLVAVASGREGDPASAIGFAVVAGLGIATYSTTDARAVQSVDPLGYLSAVSLLAGAGLFVALRPGRARFKAALRSGALIGLGSTLAYVLVLLAFQIAPAGRVATLREVSVVIAVIAARETSRRRVISGAFLVAAGAVLAGA